MNTSKHAATADAVNRLQPAELFGLREKVALVTGAGKGLGPWIAAGLAAAGASVVLIDAPGSALDEAVKFVIASGGVASSVPIDVHQHSAVDNLVDEIKQRFGHVHVLVNGAHFPREEPIDATNREGWVKIWALSLLTPLELSRAVAPMMSASGGSIIYMTSFNNSFGIEGSSVYSIHRAALCQLAKSMAIEWAHQRIHVNAICPGFFLQPGVAEDDPTQRERTLNRNLLRRAGHPSELVGCCLLLASDAGSFITGQAFHVEGGWLAATSWNDLPLGG